jgi:hypothetical protein
MKKQLLSEEFRRMQKLAGIINEIKVEPPMKLKFKEGVYGFIFDSQHDEIVKILTSPPSEAELKRLSGMLDEYGMLFTDIKTVNELFEIESKEQLLADKELSQVLDWWQ